MATIIVGSTGQYTTLDSAWPYIGWGDVVLLQPGTYNLSSKYLTRPFKLKADTDTPTKNSHKVNVINNASCFIPFFDPVGPETITFEGITFDTPSTGNYPTYLFYALSPGIIGPNVTILLNKSWVNITTYSASYCVMYGINNGIWEFRNCEITLLSGYFAYTVSNPCIVHVNKCIMPDYNLYNVGIWKPATLDYVTSAQADYGPSYGANVINPDYPFIAGTLKDNTNPVARPVRFYEQATGRILGETTSNIVDGSWMIKCPSVSTDTPGVVVAFPSSGRPAVIPNLKLADPNISTIPAHVGTYSYLNKDRKATYMTLTNNRLEYFLYPASFTYSMIEGQNVLTTGKYYWEITLYKRLSSGEFRVGVASINQNVNNYYIGQDQNSVGMGNDGNIYTRATLMVDTPFPTLSPNDVIGVAVDLTIPETRKIWFSHNGYWSGIPGTSGQVPTFLNSAIVPVSSLQGNYGNIGRYNFGDTPFTYTIPTGFEKIPKDLAYTPQITTDKWNWSQTDIYGNTKPLADSYTIYHGGASVVWYGCRSKSIINTPGKYYWEFYVGGGISSSHLTSIGLALASANLGGLSVAGALAYCNNGYRYINTSATASWGPTFDNGDCIQLAFENHTSAGKLWWGKNGTWIASGDPANSLNPAASSLTNVYLLSTWLGNYGGGYLNIGQDTFKYSVPTGFTGLINCPA